MPIDSLPLTGNSARLVRGIGIDDNVRPEVGSRGSDFEVVDTRRLRNG